MMMSSLTGAWVLDVYRSDTLEAYLRCMGAPDRVVEAQLAGEQACPSRNVLVLDDSRLVVHKHTSVNNLTESYELDQERVTPSTYGEKRAIASLLQPGRHDALAIKTALPTDTSDFGLVETRRLVGDGSTHIQELLLRNLDTGAQSITRRTWVREP
ncbi:hypothetical protein Esi_0133_0020 [Ectocarpus siliculosus]|uniref:Uncharacterized protein n=1 Tax=Ectocarpus siliculosus TaxID=2880 RepID=D7FJD1_ECTSI|nr:hypothetical protein Esi_0133_0020 [Ectocarpus siliculosus]|eukprot:CBJ29034.1 hypothetical protein Esi_0133_0020 [Ectocarpus siliculosus]